MGSYTERLHDAIIEEVDFSAKEIRVIEFHQGYGMAEIWLDSGDTWCLDYHPDRLFMEYYIGWDDADLIFEIPYADPEFMKRVQDAVESIRAA